MCPAQGPWAPAGPGCALWLVQPSPALPSPLLPSGLPTPDPGPLTSLSENLCFWGLDSLPVVESDSAVDGQNEGGYHLQGR